MSGVHESVSCRQVVERSTEFLEGVLERNSRLVVESHLEGCEDCQRLVTQLELTAQWAAEARTAAPSAERQQEILDLMRGSQPAGASAERSPDDVAESTSQVPKRVSGRSECLQLDAEMARAYLEDRLPDDQQIAVLEHLIDGCEECKKCCRLEAFPHLAHTVGVRAELRERPTTKSEERKYRQILDRLLSTAVDVVRDSDLDLEHFHLWLIRRARTVITVEPWKAVRLADLAVEIAASLNNESLARASMLKAYVVRKVEADFREADRWFEDAEALMAADRSLGLLRAKLLRMKGLARFCQSRPEEALALFGEAEETYLAFGELARYGECLLDKTSAESELIGSAEAIKRCLRASTIVEWQAFPRFAMAIGQNLSLYYADVGSWDRAQQALELSRRSLSLMPCSPVDELHLDWAKGRLLFAAGLTRDSARVLAAARSAFVEHGLASQAAWITFDLANSLIELGCVDQSYEVLEMMVSYFVSRRLPKESLIAVQLFRRSVVRQTVTVAKLRALEACLSKENGNREQG